MGIHNIVALGLIDPARQTVVGNELSNALVVVFLGLFDTVGLGEGMGALLRILVKPFFFLLYLIL